MTTLLQLFEQLATDPEAKIRFSAAPDLYLAGSGFGDLPPEDLSEALAQAADSFPPALASIIDPRLGLETLAQADLGQLGLEGVDDFDSVWEPPMDDSGPVGEESLVESPQQEVDLDDDDPFLENLGVGQNVAADHGLPETGLPDTDLPDTDAEPEVDELTEAPTPFASAFRDPFADLDFEQSNDGLLTQPDDAFSEDLAGEDPVSDDFGDDFL